MHVGGDGRYARDVGALDHRPRAEYLSEYYGFECGCPNCALARQLRTGTCVAGEIADKAERSPGDKAQA